MLGIGKRSLLTFTKRIFQIENYKVIVKFFYVHKKHFTATFNEIFSLGNYPQLLYFNSPVGAVRAKVYSVNDFSTFRRILYIQYFYSSL